MKRLLAAASISLAVAGLAPSVGHAEGQGNCRVQDGVCRFGGAVCRDNNGVNGRCRQIGNQCTCFTPNDGAKENAINIIYNSSTAAAVIVQASSSVPNACGQLNALVGNMGLSAGRLAMELGPVGFVDAELLRRVDVSLARLPVIGSFFGSTCSRTLPGAIESSLLSVKGQLLDRLLDEINGGLVE